MSQRKKWTVTEDTQLIGRVRMSPTNLMHAFKEAARVTSRSVGACQNRWYSVLSKDSANACFITVSGKHQSLNRKNGKGTPCTQGLFIKILKLLKIVK